MHTIIPPRRSVWPDQPIAPRLLFRAGEYRRGAIAREQKGLFAFSYIARGSLSEAQYFIHLARRLKYLSCEDADTLHEQTRLAFGCLHGVIGSVEKEAGKVSKVIATATSLLAIAFVRWSGSQWSVGS
jgi:23S rRNA-intervening sequence protein